MPASVRHYIEGTPDRMPVDGTLYHTHVTETYKKTSPNFPRNHRQTTTVEKTTYSRRKFGFMADVFVLMNSTREYCPMVKVLSPNCMPGSYVGQSTKANGVLKRGEPSQEASGSIITTFNLKLSMKL